VKSSVRLVLADSYVAAIAVSVLLLSSIDATFRAVWPIVSQVVTYVFTAIAIFDIPYFSSTFTVADRLTLISTFTYLYGAATSLLAAWLLSRWVCGVGPLRFLIEHRNRLVGRNHA
jgi:hypothetical protein